MLEAINSEHRICHGMTNTLLHYEQNKYGELRLSLWATNICNCKTLFLIMEMGNVWLWIAKWTLRLAITKDLLEIRISNRYSKNVNKGNKTTGTTQIFRVWPFYRRWLCLKLSYDLIRVPSNSQAFHEALVLILSKSKVRKSIAIFSYSLVFDWNWISVRIFLHFTWIKGIIFWYHSVFR